jgi:transcriptional accessory protein Tex/SPT6
MPEPVLISIAAALASRSIVGLYKFVKKKFSDDPEATAILEATEGAAEDTAAIKKLQEKLAEAQTKDPKFAEELHDEWERAQVQNQAEAGGVVNSVTGGVSGNVVQARDIQGGISF